MELFQNQGPALQVVTAYDEKSIVINGVRFFQSLLVLPDATPVLWPVSDFESLSADDFLTVTASRPELLLIGTGMRPCFVSQQLLARLSSGKMGVEYMHNPAACRTFNLLLSEGRRVALALFMENK